MRRITFFLFFISFLLCQNLNAQIVQGLEVIGTGFNNDMVTLHNNNYSRVASYTYSNSVFEIPVFVGFRSRGQFGGALDILPGDRITGLYGSQFIDNDYRVSAAVEMFAGSTINNSSYSSYIIFGTINENETTRLERMRIAENGNVGIGTDDPFSKLEIKDGDIYINDINNGVIMKSPNGNCWRMTVDDTGNFVSTAITCPN
ncbi:MAG: hypothetical protein HKN51_16135 [Saprospiraceae bacterium]|nr:hypothetical protein [Saprospiraceae bacterium]